jgi:PPOX class probable F420-dependent enzyme
MAGLRDRIRMDEAALTRFLEEERTVTCATNGPRGLPHLMPLWYVLRDGNVWAWTFSRTQKVRNLERDPRATLQVEAGERYEELRGAMLECDVAIHRDLDTVLGVGLELAARYGLDEPPVRTQAPKRVALEFRAHRVASFDHRMLPARHGASR